MSNMHTHDNRKITQLTLKLQKLTLPFAWEKSPKAFRKETSEVQSLLNKVPLPEQILVKQVVQVFGTTWPVSCCNDVIDGQLIHFVTTMVADNSVVIEIKTTWQWKKKS